jgi:hypothetical protein
MTLLTRRPLVTTFVAVLCALLCTYAGYAAVSDHPRPERSWPLIALAVYSAGAIAVFGWTSSTSQEAKFAQRGATEAADQMRVALALGPALASLAAVFLGAPPWSVWAGFVVTCLLLAGQLAIARGRPTAR